MNPPRPAAAVAASSTALTVTGSTALVAAAAAASSAPLAAEPTVPFASTPWSPSTRGWLVPTAAQLHAATLEDRSRELALAANRAANAVTLHQSSGPRKQRIVERAPARVLEEDDYLDNLERIIKRDFYPAIDAMERRIQQPTPLLAMRGGQLATPNTPAPSSVAPTPMMQMEGRRRRSGSFEDDTPAHTEATSPSREPGASSSALQLHSRSASAAAAAEATAAAATLLHPHELRLGSFLELHTSEDNASFGAINTKRRKAIQDRFFWANEEFEQKSNDQRLVLVGTDKERSGNLDSWKYKAKNALFYYPEHNGLSELDADENDKPADAVKRAIDQRSRSIEYENTRFPGKLFNPFPGINSSSSGDAPPTPAAAASSTPAVGGYRLVRTPTPAALGADESPLMTWGQILATPSHLTAEDPADQLGPQDFPSGPESRFRVAAPSARDALAWGLVDAARRKETAAKKRKRLDATPVPLGYATPGQPAAASRSVVTLLPPPSSARQTVMMSPAAQRLMEKALKAKGGATPTHQRPQVDSQLRASYASPSPSQLQHGRSGSSISSSSRRTGQRPPVPLFAATPSPMHFAPTPQHAR